MDTKLMVLLALVGVLVFVDAKPLTVHIRPRIQRPRIHVTVNDPGHVIDKALAALSKAGKIPVTEVEEFAEEEGLPKNLAEKAVAVAKANGITSIDGKAAAKIGEELVDEVGKGEAEKAVEEVTGLSDAPQKRDANGHVIDNAEAALSKIGTVSIQE